MRPLFHPLLLTLGCLCADIGSAQGTERISLDSSEGESNGPSYEWLDVSADGSAVVFQSVADNLVAGDTNGWMDVFVRDLATGLTSRVSVSSTGAQSVAPSGVGTISGDGRFVAFNSQAGNLVAGDQNGLADVFVHDRLTGQTTLVSVHTNGALGNQNSWGASISNDGRYVSFSSTATNLVDGDTNDSLDVFVHDRTTGATVRASVDSNGAEGDGGSYSPRISGDGGSVTFYSYATNLAPGDQNDIHDVFVHDHATGVTERVSLSKAGGDPDHQSYTGGLSFDGRLVVFWSWATNLIEGDTNGVMDIFVYDRDTGLIQRVSVNSAGVQANSTCEDPDISDDGNTVVFSSWATNLAGNDGNAMWDVFAHNLATGQTERASVDSAGLEANDGSWAPRVSGDGMMVAFMSWATNLVGDDTNDQNDVFVRDRHPAPMGENYCGPANLNSTGVPARIFAFGSTEVAANSLELQAADLPQGQWGYFLNSAEAGFVALPPGSVGNLCLGGAIGRHRDQIGNSGSAGSFAIAVDLGQLPRPSGPYAVQPGETWRFQCWYRDLHPGPTSNFTDGISITFE